MDLFLRTDSGEKLTKRRPEKLTEYTNTENALNNYDNLPTGAKTFSQLYTLQYLGEL